ncbi:MAG: hypothetical protein RR586_01625 [Cellulosilyticaceae bacterium]
MQPERKLKLEEYKRNNKFGKDEVQSESKEVTKVKAVDVFSEGEKMMELMTKWIWGECEIKG